MTKFTEKFFEECIKESPEAFLGEALVFEKQQVRLGRWIPDLQFVDSNGTPTVVEVQIKALDRNHLYRSVEYRDLLSVNSGKQCRVILVCNEINDDYKQLLDIHNVQLVAIPQTKVLTIAEEHSPKAFSKLSSADPDEGMRMPVIKKGKQIAFTPPRFSKSMSRFDFSTHISREWSRVETLTFDKKNIEFYKRPNRWTYEVYEEIEKHFEVDWAEKERTLRAEFSKYARIACKASSDLKICVSLDQIRHRDSLVLHWFVLNSKRLVDHLLMRDKQVHRNTHLDRIVTFPKASLALEYNGEAYPLTNAGIETRFLPCTYVFGIYIYYREVIETFRDMFGELIIVNELQFDTEDYWFEETGKEGTIMKNAELKELGPSVAELMRDANRQD